MKHSFYFILVIFSIISKYAHSQWLSFDEKPSVSLCCNLSSPQSCMHNVSADKRSQVFWRVFKPYKPYSEIKFLNPVFKRIHTDMPNSMGIGLWMTVLKACSSSASDWTRSWVAKISFPSILHKLLVLLCPAQHTYQLKKRDRNSCMKQIEGNMNLAVIWSSSVLSRFVNLMALWKWLWVALGLVMFIYMVNL